MSLINLNFRNTKEKITLYVGSDVTIAIDEDNISSIIKFTMQQFEELMNNYCNQVDEPTLEEYQNEVSKLKAENEEFKELINPNEDYEQAKRDKFYDNEVF